MLFLTLRVHRGVEKLEKLDENLSSFSTDAKLHRCPWSSATHKTGAYICYRVNTRCDVKWTGFLIHGKLMGVQEQTCTSSTNKEMKQTE